MFSKQGRRKLEEFVKRTGKTLLPLDNHEIPIRAYPRTSMILNFITEISAKRSIAKIAYTHATHKLGIAQTQSASYRAIRGFIMQGSGGASCVRLFHNAEFLTATSLTANHHAVILSNDAKRQATTALVVLFGGLCYIVELSDYTSVDAVSTYLWDAKRRTDVQFSS